MDYDSKPLVATYQAVWLDCTPLLQRLPSSVLGCHAVAVLQSLREILRDVRAQKSSLDQHLCPKSTFVDLSGKADARVLFFFNILFLGSLASIHLIIKVNDGETNSLPSKCVLSSGFKSLGLRYPSL